MNISPSKRDRLSDLQSPVQVREQPEFAREMQQLSAAVQDIDEAVGILIDRLSPALMRREEVPPSPMDPKEAACFSDIAISASQLRRELFRNVDRIRATTNALAI